MHKLLLKDTEGTVIVEQYSGPYNDDFEIEEGIVDDCEKCGLPFGRCACECECEPAKSAYLEMRNGRLELTEHGRRLGLSREWCMEKAGQTPNPRPREVCWIRK